MTDNQSLLVPCPRCGNRVAWQGNPHRPFCSEKCRLVDLGRWAGEEYRIPGRPAAADIADVIEFPRNSEEEECTD